MVGPETLMIRVLESMQRTKHTMCIEWWALAHMGSYRWPYHWAMAHRGWDDKDMNGIMRVR